MKTRPVDISSSGRVFYYNYSMPMPKKERSNCLFCGGEPSRPGYKYCSNSCQHEYQYHLFIERWHSGTESGIDSVGIVKRPIKRFLREKFDNKCYLCGWSELNFSTKVVPLVADHIDGNWRNNAEENLRLVCPNCDALSPTFSALNKGRGRPNRPPSKRTLEARKLVKQKKGKDPEKGA
jgi:hypothetical protein